MRTDFVDGTVFTEARGDSSVPGMVGTVNLTNGFIVPQIIGFKQATRLLFLP